MFKQKANGVIAKALVSCLLLGGCVQQLPESDTTLEKRIERSREVIQERCESAYSLDSRSKALEFERKILEDFKIGPYIFADAKMEQGELVGEIEATSLLLGGFSFKHQVTGKEEEKVKKIISSIIELDSFNELDGRIPFRVKYDKGYEIDKEDMHSNAYSLLFHAYNLAYKTFDDPEIKEAIKFHTGLISDYFIKSGFKLQDKDGKKIESSDISPSLFKGSTSRMLDGLVACEVMLDILDKNHKNYRAIEDHRKKMLECGYLRNIQNLEFNLDLGIFKYRVPSHGTDWLNAFRLYTLCDSSDRKEYKNAFRKFYKTQRKEHNPLFDALACLALKDGGRKIDWQGTAGYTRKYLASYPLNPDNREILNIQDKNIRRKWISPVIKNRAVAESEVPLLYCERPFDSQIGKRNPYLMNSHKPFSRRVYFSGIDFFQMYWAAEAAGFYDK